MRVVSKKKPIVAILGGTGKEGPGLARRLSGAGYRIIIGSRKLEKAKKTAESINSEMGSSFVEGQLNGDAAKACNIAILTVVQSAHEPALQGLKNALKGKILVDATARVEFRNPYPPEPPSAPRIAQDILGEEVIVVGAFQNVPAHTLKKNIGKKLNTDVLVCADDIDAANTVIRMAKDMGMRAFYAGGLDNSIVVEGMTALLISINKYYGTKTASIGISGINID